MTDTKTKAVETKAKQLNPIAQKIVDYLTVHKGEAYTLAELAEAIGVELKSSGAITRLLKSKKNPNGVIVHGAEVEKEVKVKRKVKTYKID